MLFRSLLSLDYEFKTNFVLVHLQFPCLVTTADIGFGAARIILDGDGAVSQLILAPPLFESSSSSVLFSLSSSLSFFNSNRPKKNAVQTKATGGRERVTWKAFLPLGKGVESFHHALLVKHDNGRECVLVDDGKFIYQIT